MARGKIPAGGDNSVDSTPGPAYKRAPPWFAGPEAGFGGAGVFFDIVDEGRDARAAAGRGRAVLACAFDLSDQAGFRARAVARCALSLRRASSRLHCFRAFGRETSDQLVRRQLESLILAQNERWRQA